ncbi:MAG: TlpA family protein disulfide reductase [Deltaproteobacteria bacterium]|nr:TlpA family protein disulfide reductase [Deltaproteobacteria bacterium]
MRRTLAAIALALLCAAPASAREVGEKLAPDLVLGVDRAGQPVTAGSFSGKPVLIMFWATWCSDCAHELPVAEALQKRWGERAVVLGISTDASARDLKKYLRKNAHKLTFAVSHDRSGVARSFGVREIPTNLLVDASGVVRWKRVGFDEKWLKELAEALRELTPQQAGESAAAGS